MSVKVPGNGRCKCKTPGILIDENTISQYAANGISKTGKNMTQQQKVMARYGAIMEQTTKAQGDMARTMDSPANQLRVLKARMDEAKIALGTALQPAMISVLPVLTGLANGAAGVIKSMTGMSESGDDVVLSFSEAQKILDKTVGTKFGDIAKKIETASAKTDDAISNFRTAARATKAYTLTLALKNRQRLVESALTRRLRPEGAGAKDRQDRSGRSED